MFERTVVVKVLQGGLLVGGCRLAGERATAGTCRSFYEGLYSEEEVDCAVERSFLEGLPQLSPDDRDSLEGDLSAEEVWKALKGMKGGKSPGLDGLPKEFYVQFFTSVWAGPGRGF